MFQILREIRSRKGVLHFRRRMLLSTPWFEAYLHHILASDQDLHPHNHPWSFVGVVLWGSYDDGIRTTKPLSVFKMRRDEYHKIKLLSKDVWSVCLVSKKRTSWGYKTPEGHVEANEYRSRVRRNEYSVNAF